MITRRASNVWLLAAGMVTALLAGCAAAPPKAERYVAPPPGSSWTYATRNSGSYGSGDTRLTVRLAEATWDGRKVHSLQTTLQHQLQDENAALIAVTTPAGQVLVRYDPPIGYRFPLEVGKTWRQDHVATTVVNGQKYAFTSTWTVEAVEDVTVPAGTFRAWRIGYADTTGETQTIWSVPDQLGVFARRIFHRSAPHPQGAGTREMELLTVPAAN